MPATFIDKPLFGELGDVPVTAPTVGTDWNYTVPAGELWRLWAVSESFDTAAAAANRVLVLGIQDGSSLIQVPATTPQIISQSVRWSFCNLGSPMVDVVNGYAAIPAPFPLYVLGGAVISITTVAIDAGDGHYDIALRRERWTYS